MRSRRQRALILVALLVLFPVVAHAQQPGSASSPAEGKPVQVMTVSVDFPGGSLSEYVAALKQRQAGTNVVIDSAASDVPLPSVSLKNVSVASALEWIQLTAAARKTNVTVRAVQRGTREGGNDVFVVSVSDSPMVGRAEALVESEPKQFKVASLKEVTEGEGSHGSLKAEIVLRAIDAALNIQSSEGKAKPVVRFDGDSGLLMMRGSSDEINVITQVIEEMTKQVRLVARDSSYTRLEEEIQKLKAEVAELRQAASKAKR